MKLRKLGVLAVLAALALQLELPVAHASQHGDAAPASISAWSHAPAQPQLSPGAGHAAHDPASCPVCQSLHAKPSALPPSAPARGLPDSVSVPLATPQRAHARVARTGHPPRAPPLVALALA